MSQSKTTGPAGSPVEFTREQWERLPLTETAVRKARETIHELWPVELVLRESTGPAPGA